MLFLLSLGLTSPAAAEPVSITHDGLRLHAELVQAGSDLAGKPVLLLVHGTLAHHRTEVMQTLQEAFKARGYSTLAINLAYRLDDRSGMYDCNTPHHHRHTDALDEIGRLAGS